MGVDHTTVMNDLTLNLGSFPQSTYTKPRPGDSMDEVEKKPSTKKKKKTKSTARKRRPRGRTKQDS